MKKRMILVVLGVLTVAVVVMAARISTVHPRSEVRGEAGKGEVEYSKVNEYTVSGPYTHENLTIYLIHGDESFTGKALLTLPEAMERKVVVVRETRDVNSLAIENVSRKDEVFVQAGDIVKGGQQDRVLSTDLLVSKLSGRMPIDAFCVENGRWSKRGKESVVAFGGGGGMAATKELKLAAKASRSQAKVWAEVESAQEKLSASTRTKVKSEASPSSLQLSLENEKVKANADGYVKALSAVVDTKPDIIGYVVAVNGKLSSADVYSSRALFRKLWPRLLNASAVEALAELPTFDKAVSSSPDSIREFFADAEKGKVTERAVTKRTKVLMRDGEYGIFFETRDMANGAAWIHRNYLTK